MLLDDFLRYVKIDTQSDEESESTPSSKKQYDLLNLLKKELDALRVECSLDEFGRLYGYIPGNKDYDCVGLCAHVDTALECSGKDVKPQIIKDYDLKDIPLGKSGLTLSPSQFPKLKECKGKTIITTDGTTLLGADDKAGVAIIMDVIRNVLSMKENERRPMAILFTPDEEIGRGPEHFNAKKYRAKYAYTIDGADPKLISVENFNAKSAHVVVTGKSIHPGEGKGKLLNAILLLNEYISMLPPHMTPYHTEGREGFIHVVSISGDVEHAEAHFILRSHDAKELDYEVNTLWNVKDEIENKYKGSKVHVETKDQYRNMLEVIEKHPECKETIETIYNKLGLPFEYEATRGGTDGATFSFLGCPCPNLGTGSYNHHGRYEFAVLEEMQLMSKIATEIFKI